jgi:hypothetical protein
MPDLLLAPQIVPSAGNSRAMHLGLHGGTILPHCGPGVAGLPRGTLPLITGPGACHYPWHRLPYVLFSPWSAGDPVAVITLKLARPAAYCDTVVPGQAPNGWTPAKAETFTGRGEPPSWRFFK